MVSGCLSKGVSPPAEQRLNGAFASPEQGGDVANRQVVQVSQGHGGPLHGRQSSQRVDKRALGIGFPGPGHAGLGRLGKKAQVASFASFERSEVIGEAMSGDPDCPGNRVLGRHSW